MENFKNKEDQELWSASYDGDAKRVEKALKAGADVNAVNYLNMTPLLALLDNSGSVNPRTQLKIAEILVEAGADVNVISALGFSAMSLAIQYGLFPMVKFLHENGADITLKTNIGDNYIYKAVDSYDGKKKGYVDIIEYLIENGVNADDVLEETGQTAIFRAVDLQHIKLVKLLITKGGADVNRKDQWGLTPLHYAVRHDSFSIIEFLIKSGADINAQDEYGFTPLHEAVENRQTGVVYHLLKTFKADRNKALVEDYEDYAKGDTALDIAYKIDRAYGESLYIDFNT